MKPNPLIVEDWGVIPYKEAFDKQTELFTLKVNQKLHNQKVPFEEQVEVQNHLIFCEHNPVYSIGKSGKMSHLLLTEQELDAKGIEFYPTNRGGDITFHGREQIVGYPIIDLEQFKPDVQWYMRSLEEVIILTLSDYGVIGERYAGYTGVWIDASIESKARKICAMGVKLSRWVTMHGWALNINTDLTYFQNIIPCGIEDKPVTSLEKELSKKVDTSEVKLKLQKYFHTVFYKS